MPPSGRRLTPEQVGLLRAWIDQGLKWAGSSAVAKAEKIIKPQELATLTGHSGPVTSIAFSRDGTKLASAGGQSLLFRPGEVKLWDMNGNKKEQATYYGHKSTVWCVDFSPDGKTLATGSYDKVVKLWDVADGTEKATFDGHSNWVTCLAFSSACSWVC